MDPTFNAYHDNAPPHTSQSYMVSFCLHQEHLCHVLTTPHGQNKKEPI